MMDFSTNALTLSLQCIANVLDGSLIFKQYCIPLIATLFWHVPQAHAKISTTLTSGSCFDFGEALCYFFVFLTVCIFCKKFGALKGVAAYLRDHH